MGGCLYELGFMEHTSEDAFTNFCKEKSEKDMSFQNFPYSMINVILLDHQFHKSLTNEQLGNIQI